MRDDPIVEPAKLAGGTIRRATWFEHRLHRRSAPSGNLPQRSNSNSAAVAFASPATASLQLGHAGAWILLASGEAAIIIATSLIVGFVYQELVYGSAASLRLFTAAGLLTALLYSSLSQLITAYRLPQTETVPEIVRDVSFAWVGANMLFLFLAFLLQVSEVFSRGGLLIFLVCGYPCMIFARIALPRLIRTYYRPAQILAAEVLVLGAKNQPGVGKLVQELRLSGCIGSTVIEVDADAQGATWIRESSATLARVFAFARAARHGEIYVLAAGIPEDRLHQLTTALLILPRAIRLVPDPHTEQLLHLPIRSIGSLHSVELQKTPLSPFQRFIKRAIDLVLAVPALVLALPAMAAIAIAIKASTPGPMLFRQKRLGYRGKPFSILKFRTMSVLEDGIAVRQAVRGDLRTTRVGRFLRALSLDELPQLINVIRGEMSLVGPRPHAISHDLYYASLIPNYEVRQHVKPGITGWAQVNGLRGETPNADLMRERVEADIWYAKNASPLLDLEIIFLTVVAVLSRQNAY